MRPLYTLLLLSASVTSFAQTVVDGVADLRNEDFKGSTTVPLWGTWEFYWNQLLTPDDFPGATGRTFIQAPGSWHRQGNYPALGVATFRCRLLLPRGQGDLLVHFPVVNASARVWVDTAQVYEHGVVSATRDGYTPKLGSFMISLPGGREEVALTVQIANFSYYSGGLGNSPRVGTSSITVSRINQLNGVENFFAGSLIAMFIYQIILYFLYHRGKPYLWLGLICLGVALRSMIVHGGSFLLPTLFEDVDWEIWKKIEFGSVYAISSFFPLYVYHLFNRFAPRWPIVIFLSISAFLCGAVLFTPQYTYGRLLEICHIGLLLAFIYAVFVITRAWRNGDRDARTILWGVLVSFPFILLEILKNSRLYPIDISFMYLVELGVLVFLLFQVYLLSNHYAKAYRNLEKLVDERTGELVTANSVKDRLLSVMSHDIKSPLNSLRGILQLYNQGAISKDEFATYAQQIEGDLNKTQLLVDNILLWTSRQLKGVHVTHSEFVLSTVVEENAQLLETIAARKGISIKREVPANLMVRSDRNIINLVLRNLLTNAIKFSFEKGTVTVAVEEKPEVVVIRVCDEGTGMDQATLERLLSPSSSSVSTSGTLREQGTGLGIGLCRDYLTHVGGELSIQSTRGRGSVFIVTLPR